MFQHFIIYFTAQSLKEFSQLLSTMEEERKRLVRKVCVRAFMCYMWIFYYYPKKTVFEWGDVMYTYLRCIYNK